MWMRSCSGRWNWKENTAGNQRGSNSVGHARLHDDDGGDDDDGDDDDGDDDDGDGDDGDADDDDAGAADDDADADADGDDDGRYSDVEE